jgi:hypothetical protein
MQTQIGLSFNPAQRAQSRSRSRQGERMPAGPQSNHPGEQERVVGVGFARKRSHSNVRYVGPPSPRHEMDYLQSQQRANAEQGRPIMNKAIESVSQTFGNIGNMFNNNLYEDLPEGQYPPQ